VIREARRDSIRAGFETHKEEFDPARLLGSLPAEAVFERS
jgi:hypothetical protein